MLLGLNMVGWVCQHTPQRGHGAGLERLAQLVDALGGVRAISNSVSGYVGYVDTAEGVAIKAVRQVQESDVSGR